MPKKTRKSIARRYKRGRSGANAKAGRALPHASDEPGDVAVDEEMVAPDADDGSVDDEDQSPHEERGRCP